MTLRKVDWLFVLFAIAVVVGVSMLPTPKDRNPMIPKSAEHQAIANEKDCVRCHQADGVTYMRPKPCKVRGRRLGVAYKECARSEPLTYSANESFLGDGSSTSF